MADYFNDTFFQRLYFSDGFFGPLQQQQPPPAIPPPGDIAGIGKLGALGFRDYRVKRRKRPKNVRYMKVAWKNKKKVKEFADDDMATIVAAVLALDDG